MRGAAAEHLAHAAELERRDAAIARELETIGGLADRAGRIRARATELRESLERIPLELADVDARRRAAESEVETVRTNVEAAETRLAGLEGGRRRRTDEVERARSELAVANADYRPAEMLWLGDSLHTLAGRTAAQRFLAEAPVPVTVLAGNHDARWAAAAGGRLALRGGFAFHHGDLAAEVPSGVVEVIGHHHPAFHWWDGAGARLKVPALVWSERRLILPAFSPWAAGVPWNERLGAGERLWVVAPRRVFAVRET